MKVIVAVYLVVAAGVAQGSIITSTLVRTPSLDSAIVKSERIGGNFAYSTVEGHAYVAIPPFIQSIVVSPIGIPQFPIIQYPSIITTHPIISNPGIIAQAPIITSPIVAAPAPIAPIAENNPSAVVIDEDTVAVESA